METRTFYRRWELIATDHRVVGKTKKGDYFEINRLPDIKQAMEAGKRKVDRIEESK